MEFPRLPEPPAVAGHFVAALKAARREEWPYRHWRLADVLPESMCVGILSLPIAPPSVGRTDGTRASFNEKRIFFNAARIARHAPCAVLAEGLQRPEVARAAGETLGIAVGGSYLRMEYIQDTDGAWLEPHCDIPEKLFSMVIYLCTGPDAAGWGTDIYDAERRRVGRSSAEFDSAVIFIPGANTWHGFEPRPIEGVRRLMEINYVRPEWRDREQLAFPDRPIRLG
ncbi:MAG: 2OG-Fe(II) oxygenase [Rhodospirillales bacterium]|nr:2OG-Fe(II) oxygenase [Rhodospirillales bacterium]